MSEYNAGLPSRVNANLRFRVGDLRKLGNQTKLVFSDEDGQFVRLGNMVTWNNAYSGLVKNHKGYCIKDYPTIASSTITNCSGMNFYFVNGQYHRVGGASSQKIAGYGNTGDLSFANDLTASMSSNGISEIKCSALFSGGVVTVGGQSGGANVGALASTNNGAYGTISGVGAVSFGLMASNSSNLGMAVIPSGSSNGANHIYTTTNGTAFTVRTGSGGTSGFVAATYWSPCSSAFLIPILTVSALNKSTDGFTQTACTLPGSIVSNAFAPDQWKIKAAHSNTASIILMTDGNLLRTTDGTNFSIINPLVNDPYSGTAQSIVYDGSRFILYVNACNTGSPSYWYSEDDGVTWIAGWVYEVVTDPVTAPQGVIAMQLAGSKVLMGCSSGGSSDIRRLYDMTGQIGSGISPTKVGGTKASGDSGGTTRDYNYNYLKVA